MTRVYVRALVVLVVLAVPILAFMTPTLDRLGILDQTARGIVGVSLGAACWFGALLGSAWWEWRR